MEWQREYMPRARTIDPDSTDPGESDSPHSFSDSDSPSDGPVDGLVPATSDSENAKSDSDTCHTSTGTSPEMGTVSPQDELPSSSDELSGDRAAEGFLSLRPLGAAAVASDAGEQLLRAAGWDCDVPRWQTSVRGGPATHSPAYMPAVHSPASMAPLTRMRMNAKAPRRHAANAKGLRWALDTELRDLEGEMSSLMRDLVALKDVVPRRASTQASNVEQDDC